jgi:prepilin-type processing-associated H-X9-DG protein
MGTARTAPQSYAGNAGWTPDTSGLVDGNRLGRHNGLIGLVQPAQEVAWHTGPVRLAEVTDGLSQTAAAAEHLIVRSTSRIRLGNLENEPLAVQSFCAGGSGTSKSLPRWVRFCNGVSQPDPGYSIYHGRAWISGWGHTASIYRHVMPINARNCHIYGGEEDGNTLISASSRHTGGANTLLADGSVRFVKDSVSLPVWWGLGSRDGGEALDAASY